MKRPNKFHAVAVHVDGVRFHSKGEAKRFQELRLLEKARTITGLRRQVPFILCAGAFGQAIGKLVVDFAYNDEWGAPVVEDWKGFMTPLAKWKIAHFEAQYGVKVTITGRAQRRQRGR